MWKTAACVWGSEEKVVGHSDLGQKESSNLHATLRCRRLLGELRRKISDPDKRTTVAHS